jgi:hypothetical protein
MSVKEEAMRQVGMMMDNLTRIRGARKAVSYEPEGYTITIEKNRKGKHNESI